MSDVLNRALTGPVTAPDPAVWNLALTGAERVLAGLAVRRNRADPFRVTDHEIRLALGSAAEGGDDRTPSAWNARTARRPLGVAAVRMLVSGRARSPVEAVRSRLDECRRWDHEGSPCASALDRWVARLSPAGLAAVGAEAVTWSTRVWCGVDWSSCSSRTVIGRDRWWDSPHSALLALRGRADVRMEHHALVVLSGPRRSAIRAELALVTLVDALRTGGRARPGRAVGWWPDSG